MKLTVRVALAARPRFGYGAARGGLEAGLGLGWRLCLMSALGEGEVWFPSSPPTRRKGLACPVQEVSHFEHIYLGTKTWSLIEAYYHKPYPKEREELRTPLPQWSSP